MSKPIILETIENKLEREWKFLGETIITEEDITAAGDTGITSLCVECGDLTKYIDLVGRIQIPQNSLNTAVGHWKLGLSGSPDTLPNDANGMLMGVYGYPEWNIPKDLQGRFVFKSNFMDCIHTHTDVTKDWYGGYKSYMAGGIPVLDSTNPMYYATKLQGKTTYWFICESANTSTPVYKLPSGTKMKVYGR